MTQQNENLKTKDGGSRPVDALVMLRNDIQTLRDMTQLQCSDGNWNYDPYMHGMANGLIFALSIFDKKKPKYLEAPKEWLADKPDTEEKISEAVAT